MKNIKQQLMEASHAHIKIYLINIPFTFNVVPNGLFQMAASAFKGGGTLWFLWYPSFHRGQLIKPSGQ